MTEDTRPSTLPDSENSHSMTILPQDSPGSDILQEDSARPSRSGCLWGIGGAIGCLGLVILVPAVLIIMGVSSVGGLVTGIGALLGLGVQPPVSAQVVSTQTIVQGILPLGQLVSISVQLAKADVRVDVGQGALNVCGFGADHVVQGAVEAGIDMTQISETDLQYDPVRDRYVLTVPAPQLTSCRVEFIRQYDRTTTACNADWDEARLLANYEALNSFRDDALEGGILERAQQEASLVLGNFVRLVTGKQVDIQFRSPEAAAAYPPSCNPDIPEGWRYNPQNGHWEK